MLKGKEERGKREDTKSFTFDTMAYIYKIKF